MGGISYFESNISAFWQHILLEFLGNHISNVNCICEESWENRTILNPLEETTTSSKSGGDSMKTKIIFDCVPYCCGSKNILLEV